MTRRTARAAIGLAAALLLAGCTGGSESKAPDPSATRDATTVLRDTLIASAVKAGLVAHEPDAMTGVGVSVQYGVVTLSGVVRDKRLRDELERVTAETPHVERVVNAIRVDPHRRRIEDQVGDVALAARVQTAIAAQAGVQQVVVRVDRGVATLEGSVPDAKTKTTVLASARNTSGIRNVVDRVRVAGP
ncbi:MAG TPA: BON domain-containing protein [Candidatus Elarobacter sp.]|jgi:osmotically-inducible protein OsmY